MFAVHILSWRLAFGKSRIRRLRIRAYPLALFCRYVPTPVGRVELPIFIVLPTGWSPGPRSSGRRIQSRFALLPVRRRVARQPCRLGTPRKTVTMPPQRSRKSECLSFGVFFFIFLQTTRHVFTQCRRARSVQQWRPLCSTSRYRRTGRCVFVLLLLVNLCLRFLRLRIVPILAVKATV